MTTTRARKLKFIAKSGPDAIEKIVVDMVRYRMSFFTDEQLEEIVSRHVEDIRFRQHHKIQQRNRARYGLVRGANILEAAE